jgi:HEAT repeat protein
LFCLGDAARAGGFEEDVVYQGRSLRQWLTDIRGSDEADRRKASRVLRLVGPEAADAAPALLLALRTDDLIVRDRIAAALARLGSKKVPILADALALEDHKITCGAARALALLGPEARSTARHLQRQLDSANPLARTLCALALWRVDRRPAAITTLRKQLAAGHSLDWQWASWSLAQCGPAAVPAAPELVDLLDSREEPVRRFAAIALEAIGRPAVAALRKHGLKSDSARQRVESAQVLGGLGPDADDAVGDLVELLNHDSPGSRASAARALGRIGLADPRVLGHLRKRVRDDDRDVRLEAARALGALGPAASAAMPDLAANVRHPGRDVRRAAGAALVRIGKPAVPELVKLLADSDILVRRQALEALREIGPDSAEALAALQALVKDTKDLLRPQAIAALTAVGKPAAPTLAGLLTDREVRLDAAAALARLGADGAAARPALTEALAPATTPAFRQALLAALAALGPAARESVPALVKAASDSDDGTRARALEALARAGTPARDLLPLLRAALKDGEAGTRSMASSLLVEVGGEARQAADALTLLLEDRDNAVRQAAGEALVLLGEGQKVLPAARKLLGDAGERRQLGLELLAWLGPQAKSLKEEVSKQLRDDNLDVRLAAVAALLEIDPSDTTAVAALLEMARDPQKRAARPAVFRLLARAGPAARSAVPVLAGIVSGEADLGVRLEAARALGAIGPEARAAAPALFALLLDLERWVDLRGEELFDRQRFEKLGEAPLRRADGLDDDDLWRQANRALSPLRDRGDVSSFLAVLRSARQQHQEEVLRALASIGPAVAVGAVKDLSDDLAERRLLAARVLAGLGAAAKESAPALRKATQDSNLDVAVEAAIALQQVSKVEVVLPVLLLGLEAPGRTAERAAAGLAGLGSMALALPARAKERALAETALLAAVNVRDASLRREASLALAACRLEGKEVRPALRRRLRDRDWSVRVAAATALARLDGEQGLVPLLAGAVSHGSTQARLQAIAALGRLEAPGRAALAPLRSCLTATSSRVRVRAAAALLRLAGLDEQVFAVLESGLADAQAPPQVRLAALEALAGVRPAPRRAFHKLAHVAHDRSCPAEVRQSAREVLAKWTRP